MTLLNDPSYSLFIKALPVDLLKILHLLACREKYVNLYYENRPYVLKDIMTDLTWVYYNINTNENFCLICNAKMSFSEVNDHGMNHLKEKNLLPFI